MADRQASLGFSLLEVLVALSILGATLTVLMGILGGSARSAGLATEYRQALLIAENRIAMLKAPGGKTANQGQVRGRFRWQVVDLQKPLVEPVLQRRDEPRLFRVDVNWSGVGSKHHSVSLSTVSVVRRGAP